MFLFPWVIFWCCETWLYECNYYSRLNNIKGFFKLSCLTHNETCFRLIKIFFFYRAFKRHGGSKYIKNLIHVFLCRAFCWASFLRTLLHMSMTWNDELIVTIGELHRKILILNIISPCWYVFYDIGISCLVYYFVKPQK